MPAIFQLRNQPLVAFVATLDAPRSKRFYAETLGLPLTSDDAPFALVFDAHGTMLRVTAVKEMHVAPYTVLGWQVTGIEDAVSAMQQAGIRFEIFDGMQQDELGIWTAPGGAAKVAWFKDPDGNLLSISEHAA